MALVISKILPPANVYLMGICGTGMASLAGLLRQLGFNVRGSDTQAYPPMGELLKRLQIPVSIGYKPENLFPRPDLVVIGNVIRRDNPEAQYVIENDIPYLSFPQAISSFFLRDKMSLVVAGTHGKTTTSSLLLSALEATGLEPGFMIGGVVKKHGCGFRLGDASYFILEGDEYDTAFFDKQPKFMHYRPFGAILTSIEFDHADIYPDIDAIVKAFRRFVRLIPEDGVLVACSDWAHVKGLLGEARCRVITYGMNEDAAWRLTGIRDSGKNGSMSFDFLYNGTMGSCEILLPGRHNALNSLAVIALCDAIGVDCKIAKQGLGAAQGVKRRQEVRGEIDGVLVIDDFAHHPTAVRETIAALKARYAGRRLIVVFEPRTNTSRRNIFQDDYAKSFAGADWALIREVPDPEKVMPDERFSSERLADDLCKQGVSAICLPDATAIINILAKDCRSGDVVAVFSNGAFEGIHDRLLEILRLRNGV